MKTDTVILPDGMAISYPGKEGILRMAATNIVFGKYKDDQGKENGGWTAALSMMLGEDRETYKAVKVFAGKFVQYGKFAVNVQRFESGRLGMAILAEVALTE